MKNLSENIKWTHWYQFIPSVACKCIIIQGSTGLRKLLNLDYRILCDDGSTEWVNKKYLITMVTK